MSNDMYNKVTKSMIEELTQMARLKERDMKAPLLDYTLPFLDAGSRGVIAFGTHISEREIERGITHDVVTTTLKKGYEFLPDPRALSGLDALTRLKNGGENNRAYMALFGDALRGLRSRRWGDPIRVVGVFTNTLSLTATRKLRYAKTVVGYSLTDLVKEHLARTYGEPMQRFIEQVTAFCARIPNN